MPEDSKVAVITGAGSGIGRAVSLALLKRNYKVVLAGRRGGALEETAALSNGFGQTLVVTTDVAQAPSVRDLFKKGIEVFERIDVVFNNAGIPAPKIPLEDLTPEQWEAVIAVNLTGAFFVAQAAFRVMKDQSPQGGRIINNGSVSAHAPRPDSIPYTATKHAITGLTKSLSLDGRKYNIACGQIDIGNASTSMTKLSETGTDQANGTMMAEPTISVNDVAEAVVYMVGLPLGANVQFMTVMATAMPFIGRG